MTISAIEEVDSQLFVLLCVAVSLHPSRIRDFYAKIGPSATKGELRFTTPLNLLNVLILHTSPVQVSVSTISALAQDLFSSHIDPVIINTEERLEDLQDLIQWIRNELVEDKIVFNDSEAFLQAAIELSNDAQTKVSQLGFSSDFIGYQDIEFAFARAKTLQLASYLPNLAHLSSLYTNLQGYAPFDAWFNGIICPYQYYWDNYASLENNDVLPREFLQLSSHYKQFEFLIAPLNSSTTVLGEKLTVSLYLKNVILPVAAYHQSDLNPLSLWIKTHYKMCRLSSDFSLWDQIIQTVLTYRTYRQDVLAADSYGILLQNYLACSLYYGVYMEQKVGSVENMRIQDQIRSTTSFLTAKLNLTKSGNFNLNLTQLPETASYTEFLLLPQISELITSYELALSLLNQMISTCCVLFPINGLTIRKYFELKQDGLDLDRTKREVFSIFMHVSDKNYPDLSGAFTLFCDTFLDNNDSFRSEINEIVFESLMQAKKINLAKQYYDSIDHSQSRDVYFNISSDKLWANFNTAASLDEVLAQSLPTQSCFEVVETIASGRGVDEKVRESVVALKHLFRALTLLKNFRFYFKKGEKVTPKDILDRLTHVGTDESFTPMSLVSVILEQNRKSYLVHEKLYKISVDLSIYLGYEDSWASFYKVLSACIESALIERDFNFAYKQSKALITYAVDQNKCETLNEIWLIFYQVGKFVPREWMDDFDAKVHKEKIDILIKQREIVSIALKHINPSKLVGDNSRLLVGQFRSINEEINRWYSEENDHQSDGVSHAMQSAQTTLQENLSGIIKDASESKNQASEKISNLLVSGLGWAIGARTRD